MTGGRHQNETGQATVEVALVLPVLVLLLLVAVQTVLVGRDQIAVVHAAREAARRASVDPDAAAAQAAAEAVVPGAVARLPRSRPAVGEMIAVEVTYRSPTDVPGVGPLLPTVPMSARAVMRVEQ